jgi:hypothetical protein
VTRTAGVIGTASEVVTGGPVNTSSAAGPGVMANAPLTAAAMPVALPESVYPVPT